MAAKLKLLIDDSQLDQGRSKNKPRIKLLPSKQNMMPVLRDKESLRVNVLYLPPIMPIKHVKVRGSAVFEVTLFISIMVDALSVCQHFYTDTALEFEGSQHFPHYITNGN